MFGFPSYPRKNFNKNFLRQVIFQIKFPKNEIVLKNKGKFIEILSAILPNQKDQQTNSITFKAVDNKTQAIPESSNLTGFAFSSKDSLKTLTITELDIVVNVDGRAYKSFDELWLEFEPRLVHIFECCNITEFIWTSIRKINLIQYEVSEPTNAYEGIISIFNDAIINPYMTLPGKENLSGGISNFSLKKNGKNMNLTLGLIPSEQNNKEVILDIDVFCDGENLQIADLKHKFTEINQEVFDIFNWSLKDQTINQLLK